jgi:Transposase IS116/IS110/IS902 family
MKGRVDRRLRKLPAGARVRIAREQLAQLRGLNRQIDQLHRELTELVAAHHPNLLAEQGCGAVTAAILIGHTADNQQFRSEASFAMKTGTPPIPCSSGKRTQHRLNRGGDRQLNHALHIIAVTRAHHDPATQEYLARKEAEGKTSKGALRSSSATSRVTSTSCSPSQRPTSSQPLTASRSPSPSCPQSPSFPARSEKSIDRSRASRPRRWSASAETAETNPSGPFSGPLPVAVTAHRQHRMPQIGAISPTNRPRRLPTRSQPLCGPQRAARDP